MNIPAPYNYNSDAAKKFKENAKFERMLCATPFIKFNTTYKKLIKLIIGGIADSDPLTEY
jgi:hypothetical protein